MEHILFLFYCLWTLLQFCSRPETPENHESTFGHYWCEDRLHQKQNKVTEFPVKTYVFCSLPLFGTICAGWKFLLNKAENSTVHHGRRNKQMRQETVIFFNLFFDGKLLSKQAGTWSWSCYPCGFKFWRQDSKRRKNSWQRVSDEKNGFSLLLLVKIILVGKWWRFSRLELSLHLSIWYTVHTAVVTPVAHALE